MSFLNKTVALAFAGLLVSATGAFAQAGGADVPKDAQSQGAKENGAGSVGKEDSMQKEGSMKKSGSMEKGSSMEKEGSMEKK